MSTSLSPGRERLLLWVLAGVQFSHVLDFVLLMPLGAQLMRLFDITPAQLGFFTAIYTVAAAASGFSAALVIDRFDRKRSLMVLYAGFGLTTLVCALAPNYPALLAARALAGVFGGVLAAVVYAIVADVVPEVRRGRALGFVMSAFSLASVAGVPVSLFLANLFGWRAAYFSVTLFSAIALALVWQVVPSIRAHVEAARGQGTAQRARGILSDRNHLRAFAFSSLLMGSGFLLFPFLAPYLVLNVGVAESDLPWVYFLGGVASLGAVRLAGAASDRWGARPTFAWTAFGSIVSGILITSLPPVSLLLAILVSVFMWSMFPPRMVPAVAILTSSVVPRLRGGFMSFNASLQQLAAGAATLVSSLVIGKTESGALTHFGEVGILSAIATAIAIGLAWRVRSVAQSP